MLSSNGRPQSYSKICLNKMETHIMDRRQLMVKRIMVKVKPVGQDGQAGQNGPVGENAPVGQDGQNGPVWWSH